MTVTEAMAHHGVSRYMIYKWIKMGKLEATKVRRRWVIEGMAQEERPEETKIVEWPWYVHQSWAVREGRKPQEFAFHQWPISNPRIELPETFNRYIGLFFYCDIAADVPQANQYVEDKSEPAGYRALPDPVGMALSAVKFQLMDAETSEVLVTGSTLPDPGEGLVISGVSAKSTHKTRKLWERLGQPHEGKSVKVRFMAYPRFYFLKEDGSVAGHYANMGDRGYFAGDKIYSDVHTISLSDAPDTWGALIFDGEMAPTE